VPILALLSLTTTAAIAGYAALVSTAALAVQLVREWRTWGTRVEVKVDHRAIISPGRPSESVVVFTIINHSGHNVKVTYLGLEPIKTGGKHLFFPCPLPNEIPGPWEVPARDAISLYQPVESVEDGDPDHRTRARISTSDGRTFRSKRAYVRDLIEPGSEK
jgi:hypothetical protein